MLAGVHRGWSVANHGLSLQDTVTAWVFIPVVNAISHVFKIPTPLIAQFQYGEPFVTRLRLQWLAMDRMIPSEDRAIAVSLLGSKDEVVAPEDCIDLVSGNDFKYLLVKDATHDTIKDVKDENDRRHKFKMAMTLTRDQTDVTPPVFGDTDRFGNILEKRDPDVTDVVFILHGIRDPAFWTFRLANTVHEYAENKRKAAGAPEEKEPKEEKWKTHTASYGIFTGLDFFTLSEHEEKLAWFMDQYTELKACYPKARLHFVGHSFGTLLFAQAL